MPRKTKVFKKVWEKDPIFGSVFVTRLINQAMRDGKKTVARKQVYNALAIIKEKTKFDPILVLEKALENIRPRVEVRSRRVGGAAYQVPSIVRGERQDSVALKWIISFSRKRPNKEYHTFAEKLAAELIDAFNGIGGAIAKKQEVEKIADSNKAFAHLRW